MDTSARVGFRVNFAELAPFAQKEKSSTFVGTVIP